MSTYRLTIKCDNAQIELIAKNGALVGYEMDRYLESFVNRKIESAPYAMQKSQAPFNNQAAQQYSAPQPNFAPQQEYTAHIEQPAYNMPPQQPQPQVQQPQVQYNYNQPPQQQAAPVPEANEIHFVQSEPAPQPQVQPQVQENYTQAETPAQNTYAEQEAYISLGDFLASNKSTDVFSEFIISAYYIKRVLNIGHFTLKMLNGKFYPATGTLIDMAIIDEARTRGFIESLEEDGSLKYTLRSAGESYFINQLRG